MGWDGVRLTLPFTKIAANGQGDLQRAWNSSRMSQIELFAYGDINKFSKRKPFCNATVYTDRYDDANSQRLAGLIAANYGFGQGFVDGITVFSSKAALHAGYANEWTYYRPTVPGWPLRPFDADGYVGYAAGWGMGKYVDAGGRLFVNGPFESYIEMPSTVGDGSLIYFGITPSSSGASAGLLSLSDFSGLQGFFNFGNWYFGLALISKNNINNDRYLVLTNRADATINEAANVTSAVPNDDYYILPILAEANTVGSWDSNFPTRVVTLDGWYGEITKTSSVSGFEWGVVGSPYMSGGFLKVDIAFKNTTGLAITINRMFTYAMADETAESGPYLELTDACQYWVNNKAEKTGGAGVTYGGNVVAVYKQLATSLVIAAGYNGTVSYAVTNGSTDALGHAYNMDTDVRLCLQYDTNNYVCDKIY